jgi:hypothetical protein
MDAPSAMAVYLKGPRQTSSHEHHQERPYDDMDGKRCGRGAARGRPEVLRAVNVLRDGHANWWPFMSYTAERRVATTVGGSVGKAEWYVDGRSRSGRRLGPSRA